MLGKREGEHYYKRYYLCAIHRNPSLENNHIPVGKLTIFPPRDRNSLLGA